MKFYSLLSTVVKLEMKFVLKPSLEHIALVKIAATLWNQSDIRALIMKFCFLLVDNGKNDKWQNIEDKILEKVLLLAQPKLLKEKILRFIKPIGLQILKWMKYHRDPYFDIDLPNELCWTPQGTVDKKKTAEMIIKDGNLNVIKCYKLACIYCLKNNIIELWHKIPEDYRKSIYNEDFPGECRQQDLVVLMSYDIKQEVDRMENMIKKILKRTLTGSPYRYAFGYAADGGNKVAVEYFFQKLSPAEREESLFWAAKFVKDRLYGCYLNRIEFPKEYYVDVLCFLLSQLDEKQQIKLIKGHTYEVLKCFLDFPWQSFFMETASCMWDFLDKIDYDCLLEIIVNKMISGYKDWNYQKLLEEFWIQSPIIYKNYCIGRCASNSTLLPDLFKIGDKENIKLILKSATVEEKQEIIFNYNGKNICENLVYSKNFDALHFLLQECITSKDVVVEFKEEFKEHIKYRHSEEKLEKEKDLWNEFFQLLDDFVC